MQSSGLLECYIYVHAFCIITVTSVLAGRLFVLIVVLPVDIVEDFMQPVGELSKIFRIEEYFMFLKIKVGFVTAAYGYLFALHACYA